MVSPGASLPQVIYEHSIEASYRGEVLTLVNSELSYIVIYTTVRYWPLAPSPCTGAGGLFLVQDTVG